LAVSGPAFVTVIVYVNGCPGSYGFGSAVFVTASPTVVCGSVALDEQLGSQPGSLVPAGGETVAVFEMVPLVDAGTVPVTV
jgi:hypothetical protein